MNLIKLSEDHYAIVTQEQLQVGDYYINTEPNNPLSYKIYTATPVTLDNGYKGRGYKDPEYFKKYMKKIVASTLIHDALYFKITHLDLDYVKSLVGGIDVEKKAIKYATNYGMMAYVSTEKKEGYITGYQQCLEDIKDEDKTTEILNHLCDKMESIPQGLIDYDSLQLGRYRTFKYMFDYIKSLTKTKDSWDVEFIDGQLKLK